MLPTLARSLGFLRGNVLVMTVCECVWRSTVDVIWPFLSLYVLELGGSYETIGYIMGTASLASMILYPLGGYIADYQGRIKIIGYMTFLYAFAFLITGLGESWQWLALGMFVQNLTTFYWPAIQALMADSIPPSSRGLGFAVIEAVPSAFGLIAPPLGAFLIGSLGMRTAMRGMFFAAFFIAAGMALYRLRFLRETVENPRKLDTSPAGLLRLLRDSYAGIFGVLTQISRPLWVLSILITAMIFTGSLASSFWIIRATKVVGITTAEWATVILCSMGATVILGIPAGRIVDRLSKKKVAGASLIILGAMSLYFLRATTFIEFAVLAAASGVVDAFLNPCLRSLFADLTPRSIRGRAMALVGGGGIHLVRNVGASSILGKMFQTAGMFLSGYVYSLDTSLPWLILSGSLALIGILLMLFVRDPEKPEV